MAKTTKAQVDPKKASMLAVLSELTASVEAGEIPTKGALRYAFLISLNKMQ